MKKILVIEDEEQIRAMLKLALEEEGYEILSAENGEKGMEMAHSSSPDIILLDIMLPDMDGNEICRLLRSDQGLQSVPILMLTALGNTESVVQGLSSGADDYISKPFNFSELLARVKAHLRMKELYDIIKREEEEKSALLDVSRSLSSTSGSHEVLYAIVSKIAEIIEVKRCSIIHLNPLNKKGTVMASHDSKDIRNLEIDLEKYPEIREIMDTGEPVVINDVSNDPILYSVRDVLGIIDIRSIMAFPICFKDSIIGTLILRTFRREAPFSDREIKFCSVISHLAAAPLKNAYLVEILQLEKDQERNKRLLAEEKIKLSKELLASILETTPAPTCVFSMEGNIINANAAYLKEWTNGMTLEESAGLNILTNPEDQNARDFFEKILEGKSLSTEMDSAPSNERETRSYIFQGAPLLDSFKKVMGGVFTTTDITERKRAHENFKLLALFAEMNPAPVLRCDKEGVIQMANPAALKIFNVKDLAGAPLLSFLPSLQKSEISNCISNNKVLFHPVQIGGNFFQFTIRGSSEMGVAQVYGSDITQRKEAEEEMGRLFEKLNEKVDELEKFRELTMGREERIIQLKDKARELEDRLEKTGKEPGSTNDHK